MAGADGAGRCRAQRCGAGLSLDLNAREPGSPALSARFRAAEPVFEGWLDRLDTAHAHLVRRAEPAAPGARFCQDWFPRLDAALAYTLVRALAPPVLVEIGAGHSTRWFAQAIADGRLATRQIAIDPNPRAPLPRAVVLHAARVESLDRRVFAALAAGCVLSLDGSHRCTPGGDVDVVVNRLLPTLPAGAVVHIHDIFLPDPYPAAWRGRHYDEQQAVAALLAGGDWALLWSSHWVVTRMVDRLAQSIAIRLPLPSGALESSLWMVRSPPP